MKFKFFIKNLFDRKNVVLDFREKYLILLSENGQGKTTILKMMYYLLSAKYSELIDIKFDEIGFMFDENEIVSIKYNELNNLENKYYEIIRAQIDKPTNFVDSSNEAKEHLINVIFDMVRQGFKARNYNATKDINFVDAQFTNNQFLRREIQKILVMNNYSPMRADTIIRKISMTEDNRDYFISEEVRSKIEKIRKYFHNITPLFLPTYRRIETEFNMLDHNMLNQLGSQHINFGMGDIINRIDEIKRLINDAARKAYTNVTGVVLTHMLKHVYYVDFTPSLENINYIERNKDKVSIALSRVGESISLHDKEKIIQLINDDSFKQSEYSSIMFIVSKLLEALEEQEVNSNALMLFSETCNFYLRDKVVLYNNSEASITFCRNQAGNEVINVQNLSSGEKQIVSILAKIFLYPEQNYFVLFDEPELSISVEWQERLLPDILKSSNCKFLLAVTHSPFIFDNYLINNTKDLTTCCESNYDR